MIEAHFERSYLCPEFTQDSSITPEEMDIKSLPFNSEKYRYKYLFSPLSMEDFGKKNKPEDTVDIVPDFLKTWE